MAVALVLSGGTGTRLGINVPKQYIEINDRSVISYCMEQLAHHERIDSIQIVAAKQWHKTILSCFERYGGCEKFRGFSQPGENRQLSIYNGLVDIRKYASASAAVMIHDAARPLLSAQMITSSLDAIEGHEGVLPVLPMKDTVYRSADGERISALLNRSEIYAGQAPETFQLGPYYEANRRLLPEKIKTINGSTEPAVLAGMDIVMIPGDEGNFKITTKEDLQRFCEIITQKKNRQEE